MRVTCRGQYLAKVPEPVVASPGQAAADPADQVTLDDEVSYALLVVMETLSPAEWTAFVLHDLFGVSFDETRPGRRPGLRRICHYLP